MQSKKFKFGLDILGVSLIILVICLLIFLVYRLIRFGKLTTEENSEDQESEELTQGPIPKPKNENSPIPAFYKKVNKTLPNLDSKMKTYITAQAMHETGIFTSELFLEHNNAFGMKMPSVRDTTATAMTENGFAHYDSVEDSIRDLQLYFENFNYPDSFENATEYIKFAKEKGYFEAPLKTYTNAVNKHLNTVLPYAQ